MESIPQPIENQYRIASLWYNPDMNGLTLRGEDSITTRLLPGLRFLADRRMLLPLQLFLSTHRPLAFVIGQGLWLCSPIDLLLPGVGVGDWAALLSHPRCGGLLEQLLDDTLRDGFIINDEKFVPAEPPE